MKSRAALLETLASRKALFASLVASAHRADDVRADIAERRAKLDAEEKRFEDLVKTLPIRLATLNVEIRTLEDALTDPEDIILAALK